MYNFWVKSSAAIVTKSQLDAKIKLNVADTATFISDIASTSDIHVTMYPNGVFQSKGNILEIANQISKFQFQSYILPSISFDEHVHIWKDQKEWSICHVKNVIIDDDKKQ